MVSSLRETQKKPDDLATDDRAQLDLARPLSVLGVLIGVIVISAVIATTIDDVFTNVADVNAVFADPNTTLNDTTTDNLLTIMTIVIGVSVLFGIVTMILVAFRFRDG